MFTKIDRLVLEEESQAAAGTSLALHKEAFLLSSRLSTGSVRQGYDKYVVSTTNISSVRT